MTVDSVITDERTKDPDSRHDRPSEPMSLTAPYQQSEPETAECTKTKERATR